MPPSEAYEKNQHGGGGNRFIEVPLRQGPSTGRQGEMETKEKNCKKNLALAP